MTSLNASALLYSTHDDIVVPRTSLWLGFYAPGQDTRIVPWNRSAAYQEDRIGLRTLDESGRVHRWSANCSNADLPRDDCKTQTYDIVVRDLLNNTLP